MTPQDRIDGVARLGFTERQARFLVTVMTHSGVCLPRHYATFAGVAYGHRINRFFYRLVDRGFASVCPCLHNRALVYHVQHRGLYAGIGEPHSRFRRPVPAASVMPRLMLLDAVLEAPYVHWLAYEHDKVEHFTTGSGILRQSLPQQASRASGAPASRLFPDALPIGVEPPKRAVFVYPATRSSLVDFRPFVRRHHALLGALHAWTIQLVFPPDESLVEADWQAVVEREVGPLLRLADHPGRLVEWRVLGHRYGHLSPLVAASGWSREGVEQGEQGEAEGSARSQPPWLTALHQQRRKRASARKPTFRTNNYWPCVI
ncbi:MAG: hypothetical protein KA745_08695 [Gemmatimonadales bacterium]|nr:hypothetical protein [Gemmatimonadales bacterium]